MRAPSSASNVGAGAAAASSMAGRARSRRFSDSRADDRAGLERLCHYLLRPPLELLEKLAVLVPRPRVNLLLYHGVLAPHARWRAPTVRTARPPTEAAPASPDAATAPVSRSSTAAAETPRVRVSGATCRDTTSDTAAAPPPRRYWAWADLLRRIFAIDALACAQCGGRLRLIATIEEPAVVDRILRHLGLPTDLPDLLPPRPPPAGDGCGVPLVSVQVTRLISLGTPAA
jgi:hypothetical protein